MKAIICLLVMAFSLACCKSKEKVMSTDSKYLTSQLVEMTVKENIRDTVTMEISEQIPRQEQVKLTQGTELLRYCVIVGSFMYQQNAVRLRSSLAQQGFMGCSIMQNDEGMYRVSAVCADSQAEATSELLNIRRSYPQFADAWLLEVKK